MSTSLIMVLRFFIAAIALLAIFFKDIIKSNKNEIFHGSIAGIFLFIAFYSQTLGQAYTTVSNSAFLTSTNVVMVPFIVWIATKKCPETKSFILTVTTLIGIAILTLSLSGDGLSFGFGDIIILISAFCFALHISYLGVNCRNLNSRRITFWQITVAAIISLFVLLLFDVKNITASQISKGILPVIFLGIFSTCLCYLIQTKAQTYTSPVKAGAILSTEGLFGSLFSVLLGLEMITTNLVIGGVVIMSSVVLMEIDIRALIKRNH